MHLCGRRAYRSCGVLAAMLVALSGVDNVASNAVCRRAGFTRVGSAVAEFRGAALAIDEWVMTRSAVVDESKHACRRVVGGSVNRLFPGFRMVSGDI